MRHRSTAVGISALALAPLCILGLTGGASGQPASGPRERVDQAFTTSRPGTPTGLNFKSRFHAAGNRSGNPPYIRRVIVDLPGKMTYHTGVPPQCTASDAELEALGPDACPPGSQIGTGTTEGLIFEPFGHSFVFDHYKHDVIVMNGKHEQILLVKSEGYTVARGRVRPDGSLAFTPPACFPAPAGDCVDDYVMTLKSTTDLPPYTRKVGGRLRSYTTTPARCPRRGYWRTKVRVAWTNGAHDAVTSRERCKA
jgi:hypothetical protein